MVLKGMEYNEQNMPSPERSAEREKQTARMPVASAHAMSPHKNALTKKQMSTPDLGTMGAEVMVSDKLVRLQRKNLKHAKVKRNKELLAEKNEMRINKILNKGDKVKKEKEDRLKEEELDRQEMEEQKSEKKKRLLQSKKTLELDLKSKMKSVEKRLQHKQTLAEEIVLQTRTSIISPVKTVMRNSRKPMSTQNSEIFNSYQSGNKIVKSIMKPSI